MMHICHLRKKKFSIKQINQPKPEKKHQFGSVREIENEQYLYLIGLSN